MWDVFSNYWHIITTVVAAIDIVIVAVVIAWILAIKREATSAIAWSLLVILLPFVGAFLFLLFGYQSVERPLKRKRRHRVGYRSRQGRQPIVAPPQVSYEGLGLLAEQLDGSPILAGNRAEFFHHGPPAFDAIFAAIERARHHIHLEFFIFRTDDLGERMLAALTAKARAGVEVRLLTDGIGARAFGNRQAKALAEAGGRWASFLPVSLWPRQLKVNLRNHRKIVVVDGQTAFTGGLNVGDEYLGKDPKFGPWRDTFLQVEGPIVETVQRVFVEDWDFSANEQLEGPAYFPALNQVGDVMVQTLTSGPDAETKTIREVFFAAMLRARKRLWVTTPYYVPDDGIRDALRLAAMSGVDVRLLIPQEPDHWTPYFAGRYYLPELLEAGVKVYLYANGFLHAKCITVDGRWASVGSANLDNRSLRLNFEMNLVFHSPHVVAELDRQFEHDLDDSHRLDGKTYAKRRWPGRLAENVCRLFSPVL